MGKAALAAAFLLAACRLDMRRRRGRSGKTAVNSKPLTLS